jgi:cell division protein ZapE
LGFYLVGSVGVGKTMILDFFFKQLNENKLRLHFNEFMIEFHDFIFANKHKTNGIDLFVNNLSKKAKLIYFDEFQVTNIVDAMILGKLFKRIFEKKVRVIFSSNTKIKDLYKDGLQRDQFIPFIKVLELKIKNFYEKVVKFDFEELCNKNLGSEDYITIASNSDFIFIENLPNFTENNSDQQQRFITLIDIIYEKKVPLMITSHVNLSKMTSSKNLIKPFQRTVSRLYELTSIRYN